MTLLEKSDISKIKNLVNWEPKVELEDGLKETIRYFESVKLSKLIKNCLVCGSSMNTDFFDGGAKPLATLGWLLNVPRSYKYGKIFIRLYTMSAV